MKKHQDSSSWFMQGKKIKQNQTLKTSVLSIASTEKVQQKFDSTHIQI